MCGVGGIASIADSASPPGRSELLRMTGALHHRGPDDFGVHCEGAVGLAHTRLSIIDRAGGGQPMASADGHTYLSYNGEVFNYVELREELSRLGRQFRTTSDTEVVLAAWLEWGDDAFRRFNGQFALAIWDERRRLLVLARDRLGVRPLYTCEHRGRLYFASEVKAIFAADPTISRAFDPLGLDETFTFWTVVAPRSVFAAITELEPGHVRTYDLRSGSVEQHPFFSISFPTAAGPRFEGSLEEATSAVEAALDKAVRLRMTRADVPVGAYLSGGLDSSLVAALAHRSCPRFSTFSLRFEDAEYDETRYQRLVAEGIGTDHHEVVVSRDDIGRIFPDVVRHTERPLLRTAPAPLFLLSRLVHNAGIKVVLTGEGADELFAGYDLFREGKVRRFWGRQPSSTCRPRLLERLYPYLARSPVAQQAMARKFFGRGLASSNIPGFAHDPRWRSTSAVKRIFSADLRAKIGEHDAAGNLLGRLPSELASWSPLAQDQWFEMKTLLSGYLLSSQGDRVLMGNSVEGRFPFLDTEVADLACALPDAYKLRVLDEKHVLKRVAGRYLPPEITARTKQPYRAPDALSFVGEGARSWAPDILSRDALEKAGVFDPDATTRLWQKCKDQAPRGQFSNADNMALVGVLSTQLLHQEFVARCPDVSATHL